MLIYSMPKSKMQLDLLKRNDIPGIISMAIGLGCLIYVLEEGQRKDWMGYEPIRICTAIAVVFLIFFVVRELMTKFPLVNLRLLAGRNFGLGTLANVSLGFALYSSVYLLPVYLAIVQGYSAWQIGQVLMWSGLPQLAITPFVPALMKRIDPRALVTFGLVMFGISCGMNGFMSHDYAGEQLIVSMVVRALGFPFIITPLSALATADVSREDTGSASALFNMMRNLGGSIGTALASTLVTQREQFHSFRLLERVSDSDLAVQAFIADTSRNLLHSGASAWSAHQQALQVLANQVRKEAFVMAFNDAFAFVALVLFLGALVTMFMTRPQGALQVSE
jgi:DHA2 family multidrug resistance protein